MMLGACTTLPDFSQMTPDEIQAYTAYQQAQAAQAAALAAQANAASQQMLATSQQMLQNSSSYQAPAVQPVQPQGTTTRCLVNGIYVACRDDRH